MKINKMADENKAPAWFFEKQDAFTNVDILNRDELKRLASLPQALTEDQLVSERDQIEKCAQKGTVYHYNVAWDKNTVASLKEYALACNLDSKKIVAASIDHLEGTIKTASVQCEEVEQTNTLTLSDPFHLDSIPDAPLTAHKREHWEKEGKQSVLTDKPSVMSNAIKAIRGGEDFNTNSYTQTARGQNSIGNPDAIENYTKEEDTGERLRKENEEKRATAKKNHEEWQNEKIAKMSDKDLLSKINRSVFPTEVLNAQPGIKGNLYDFEKIPDKTEGEKIRESNKEYKKQIRGEEKAKHEFSIQSATPRSISDEFTESLKKAMGKK